MSLVADAALAADLVREAGQLAAEMRGDGLRTEHKSSLTDVVTAADRAAERLITDHLAAFRPADGVLGEEGASKDGTSGRTWVIDPVDGTYNFVSGLDWWCSAIALTDGDCLVLGAVHHPATGRTMVYVACEIVEGEAHAADADEIAAVHWCHLDEIGDFVPYGFYEPVQLHLEAQLA